MIGVLALFSRPALAQMALPLTLFPAIQDKEVAAGAKTRLQIQVKNDAATPVTGQLKAADYIVSDKDGTPRIVENNTVPSKYSAAHWITLSADQIAIPAKDFVTVDIYVNVPDDVSGCGHYALVYFQPNLAETNQTGAVQTESTAKITTKIAALLNFKVNSFLCRELANFGSVSLPAFKEYGPIALNFDVLNLGDVDIKPQATVALNNQWGQTVARRQIKDVRIFPEAAKNYRFELGEKMMFGRYRGNITLTYGTANNLLSRTFTVWVFPWRIALAIILTIVIIILLSRNIFTRLSRKEALMEKEIEEEKEEITKLKQMLKKRE